ncbi:MAG: protein kinase, partial [Candidatus Acidiferrales bacterium]
MLTRLGKYEIIEEIGRGAMGEVYKAHDPSIGRLVALKTIMGSLVGNTDLLERFYREARSAGTLQHPNIVTIYELGKEGDTPFIAMEFLEGESLEKVINRRPVLSLLEKVGYIVPVCRALDYAHRRGVVHRDIKPGNMMLTKDGNVKVVDFGIARFADTLKTRTDVFIGTLAYMSPQQIHGERADERSDIWALGVTFYELLSYRRPFDGGNHADIMLSIVNTDADPPSLTELVPDCPPRLAALVGKMLQKDITRRFQTMEDVLSELEPLWKTVQEAGVSGLIADSEVAFDAQDFGRARELLRRALQIDSRNEQAKTLLERFNTETKRSHIGSQVKSALDSAQNLLKEGRHQEARSEVEAALRLDSTFAPAHELLAELDRLASREKLIQENLRSAKQRLTDGALTEATREIQKVLDLDAANAQGLALHKQIQDQRERREKQMRLADILQRARKLWGEQKLNECIALLTESQEEFPNEPEIAKLLSAAKADLSEQERQQKLAQARGLLAEQRFDDALAIIEALSGQQPADPTVQKLRALAVQEKEAWLRAQKLQAEVASLQFLVYGERYSEVVSRGEELLREFPGHADIVQFVGIARSEIAQLEHKKILKESLQAIRKKMDKEQFQDAVEAADKALGRLPGDPDLEAVRGEARAKQKEKETRDLLHKRIAEISRNIKRGQHTDAVDLARQTLTTVGQDSEVQRLLNLAEMELTEKRNKKEEQDKRVTEAQTLLQEGQVDAATQILQVGLETKIFSKKNPLIRQLLNEIKEKKAAAIQPEPLPLPRVEREDEPEGKPAKDYTFEDRTMLQQEPPTANNTSTGDLSADAFSATRVIDPSMLLEQSATAQHPAIDVSVSVEQAHVPPATAESAVDYRQSAVDGETVPQWARIFREQRTPIIAGASIIALL